MAKTKKEDNLKGFINGKSHYTMEGKDYVKNSSAPDPERLKHDPAYAAVRANNALFGSLSTVATAFREGIKPVFENAIERRLQGPLTAFFRSLVSDGRKILNLREHRNALCSYTFKKGNFFNTYTGLIPHELVVAADRSLVSLQLLPFTRRRLKSDQGRTHFRMTLAVMPFADSVCTTTEDSVTYLPLENPLHGKLLLVQSAYTDICFLEQAQQVTITIPEAVLQADVSLVVFINLAFYEEVNGSMYVFGTDVMKVAEVF